MLNTIHSAYSPNYTRPASQSLTKDATLVANRVQSSPEDKEVREAFDQFVGETFFGQMLKAMRKTVDKPAYFHGGQAEEMFRGQLDQMLAEKMSDASAGSFTDSMFNLFELKRG